MMSKVYCDDIDYPITVQDLIEMHLEEEEEDDYNYLVDYAYDSWD